MKHLVAPSLLASDFGRLNEEITLINESAADWLHLDIMDGKFVPNISFGFPVLKAVQKIVEKPMDVHLMIVEPERYIDRFRDMGASMITVHYEVCPHLHSTISQIKSSGAGAGVALNPHTPVESLRDILEELDLVCIMSVNPGFGGQKFIPHTLEKIRALKQMIVQQNASCLIEVDGGVTLENAGSILRAGVDVLVAGSTVFKSANPKDTVSKLKSLSMDTLKV